MEVVVTGRHCEVSDRFREHVAEKLSRLEKHDHRIMRVQVEVENEKNPRQHDRATRVQLTAISKGPVIRAEAGEAAVATVELEPRSLQYWSVDDHAWRTEPGEYAVQVGTSVAALGEPIRFTV